MWNKIIEELNFASYWFLKNPLENKQTNIIAEIGPGGSGIELINDNFIHSKQKW